MMRRSSGMGGGNQMLRAMGRAITTGVKENVRASKKGSDAKGARVVSLNSPRTTPVTSPTAVMRRVGSGYFGEDDEWENVAFVDEDADFGFEDRRVFGPVPTKEEAEDAVSTIQQIFVPVTFSQFSEDDYSLFKDEPVVDKVVLSAEMVEKDCSTESESDWMEPAMQIYSSKASKIIEREKVLDAFHMLQINQPFKRMVTSLSSDPAVWNAVMNNEVVQELKASLLEVESSETSSKDEDNVEGILSWILKSTKGKIMEFFDKITKLANEIFHSQEKDNSEEGDAFDDMVRSSFMLAVVVFIVVVATRIQKA